MAESAGPADVPAPVVPAVPARTDVGSHAAPATVASSRPFWQRRSAWTGLLLGLLVVGILSWRILTGGPPAAAQAELAVVTVTVPGRVPVESSVTFTGAISARYDMPIGVEGEGGRIAAVLVEVGDRVRRGQVLARLDTSVVAPQVASLRAAVEQQRAEAELAKLAYERAERIANSVAALSKEEVDRRRSQLATAEARVRAAEAQLAESNARFGRTEIRAPADGIVLTRNAEAGQTATPGGPPLFRLGRGGEIEMRGQVAEQDLPRLAVGQPAEVRVTGVAEPFAGKVRLLGAVIDPATRLGEIRIELAPDPDLRPGAFARGEVLVGRDERPVLPQTAVLADAEGNYVMVVEDDGTVHRRRVRIAGTSANGVAIADGLQGTERVVATAGAFLREGETVRPVVAGERREPAKAEVAGAAKAAS